MPNKFRNVPTTIDGIKFDSKAEARRYGELKLLQMAGEISRELKVHPSWPLKVNDELICTYEADFQYLDSKTSRYIVEDVKSPATRKDKAYRMKSKLMKAIYGIEVIEVVYK